MEDSRGAALIREWHERFKRDPLASAVVCGLRGRSREIWQQTFQLLQQESPEYRNSIDDEFTDESRAHCGELLKTIISIPNGCANRSDADSFDFVRAHAVWRARRQVPLIASLHAYRLAHRTYSEISQEELSERERPEDVVRSLTMLSNFWIQLFDHVGAVLAEAHAVEDGLIVAQGTRNYVAVMDDLLRGTLSADAEAQRLCKLCGIRPGAPLAIAVARPYQAENGKIIDLEVTLRSFVRLIEQVLSPGKFGRLIDIRGNEVIAIACSEGDVGQALAKALRRSGFTKRAGNGHSARVGISFSVKDIALLPQALAEARMALEFTSAGKPIGQFSDIDLSEFLIRRADSAAMRLIPEWAKRFASCEDDQSRELARTIRAFADAGLNVKQTAQILGVHTNTVYFRLNRIQKLSGLDPRAYSGLTTLLAILRLLELHPKVERGD
jgi:hypothetical protein